MSTNRVRKQPSCSLHKASGQARIVIGGRSIYLGKYGSPEAKAEHKRLMLEWVANDGHVPSLLKPTGLSVAELAAAYKRFAKRYYVRDGHPTVTYDKVALVMNWLGGKGSAYGRTTAKESGSGRLRGGFTPGPKR